jgi:trans-aconitate 2-methyltransferase
VSWDPAQYLRYADERSRPFHELLGRITIDAPRAVVDLGCGPGDLTATLSHRWPSADIIGVDNDERMISAAGAHTTPHVRFVLGDIAAWVPDGVDAVVANASLQWVPDHRRLLPHWIDGLASGGVLAFQVPANFDDPHHQAIRNLVASPPWCDVESLRPLVGQRTHGAAGAIDYASDLIDLPSVASVDAWETTYVHVLQGSNPVLEWVKGTALRPVLALLDEEQQSAFCSQLGVELRALFPRRNGGTMFPFRRAFVIARRS